MAIEHNSELVKHNKAKVFQDLKVILADSALLAMKTQNFHWNVTGIQFYSLHLMFENQYKDLAIAVDDLAERIRTLDFQSPGSFKEFLTLSNLKEADGKVLTGVEMVTELQHDHEVVISNIKKVLPSIVEAHDDETADLLIGRLEIHEKTAWMLRSSK